MNPEIAARLDSLGIAIAAEGAHYCLFARDRCVAIVPSTFGAPGSTGMSLDQGLAYLVWRDGQAFLVGHGFELPAHPDQVDAIRRFTADLHAALAPDADMGRVGRRQPAAGC